MRRTPRRTALILGDGGARAAYQVGVLKAIGELLPDKRTNPFPVLCGTSGGAINAGILAAWAEDFGAGIGRLEAFWSDIRPGDAYRTDLLAVAGAGAQWSAALAFGWLMRQRPRSLLDNAPLRKRLEEAVDLGRIEGAIAGHALLAVGFTCSGYDSGQGVTFFQGRADLDPWRRPQRVSAHVRLTIDHLLASLSIPFLFPAVKLNREWFGDGALRQAAPLSPAIHLGADRLLVIGPGDMASDEERAHRDVYPTWGQIAGHGLAGCYADNLAADLETAIRINRHLAPTSDETRHGGLRHIDILHIAPSRRLDRLAAEYRGNLPTAIRALLRSLGAMEAKGDALVSCLLFDPAYVGALLDLGYTDAMARREELRSFLA